MEIILFTATAAVLYLFSDWLLNYIESRRGQRFEHRSIIFFVIIMVLALASFSFLERLVKKPNLETSEKSNLETTESINKQIQKPE